MNSNDYRNLLIKPINEDSPVGIKLSEDTHFDFIETQLMKIGSLAHEEIEWDKVEKAAFEILVHKSKDLKVLGYLIQCLQYQVNPERFILSINILADFIQHFWPVSNPLNNARENLARQRLLSQIIQRTMKSLVQTSFSEFTVSDKHEFEIAVNNLKKTYALQEIPDAELDKLTNSLIRLVPSSEIPHDEKSLSQNNIPLVHTQVTIDTSDSRALKKTLIQISELLLELNQKSLSIETKRLALWHTIHTPPPHKTDGETELVAISTDKLFEYQEQIGNPNDELWKKLEQSILLSPFWLDGHYLSYQIAKKLGYLEVATTIKKCITDFVDRIPTLRTLKFKGGLPFISDDTQKWLNQDRYAQNSNIISSQLSDIKNQATEIFNTQGFSNALIFLNIGLESANNLRDQTYWKIALAEIYTNNGLFSIANDIYKSIQPIIENTLVINWEPILVNYLQNKIDKQ